MRVLLTGGSGFLGSHVAEKLRERGDDVRALVRRSSNASHLTKLGCELAYAVLERGEGLDEALDGVDAVVHCAGIVKARSPEEFHEVNAGGTRHLVEAARKRGGAIRRFVYVSSLEAWGPSPDGVPATEDMPPRPTTHYGRSKLAGEQAALAAADDLPVTVLRPTGIYGPRDTEILQLFKIADRGILPLINDRDATFTMIYGPDAAAACVSALDVAHSSGSVFFLTDGNIYSWGQAAGFMEAAIGKKMWASFKIPAPLVTLAAISGELKMKLTGKPEIVTREKLSMLTARHLVASAEKIQRELGWKPTLDFAEGARLTVAWYREHGWM
jgi:nucleoside-diphosphate-sugar epimerase